MAKKPPKRKPAGKAKPRGRRTATSRRPVRKRTSPAKVRRRPRRTAGKAARTSAAKRARKPVPKRTRRTTKRARPASRRPAKTGVRTTAPARKKTPGKARIQTKRKARVQTKRKARPQRPRIPRSLLRERRTLVAEKPTSSAREVDEHRYSSAAMTGKEELLDRLLEHTETGPVMTGEDLDGDWQRDYLSGDEAPGGENPTPDQGMVDENGRTLGIHYDDNEELKLGEKEADRDKRRWELDPASAEDYRTQDED